MSKYRIVNIKKQGYYDFYQVQKREWFFVPYWNSQRSFNTKKEALAWIERETVKTIEEVVYSE